ncbi:MAG TPA: DUF3987 domain-containing protein [Methylocystis sp.]|jgi:hypothetical protein
MTNYTRAEARTIVDGLDLGPLNERMSSPGELRFGKNGSLSIDLDGNRYYDNEAKEGNGLLDLVMINKSLCNIAAAFQWAEQQLGVGAGDGGAKHGNGACGNGGNGVDPFANRDVKFKKANKGNGTSASAEQTPDAPPRIVATYAYVDENDQLLFEVVRFEPKKFLQRRKPTTTDAPESIKRGWVWSVKGARQVPYRLPELLAAIEDGGTVFFCEGEKDVDNLAKLSIPASCNAMGAGKFPAEIAACFKGADLILIPDNDKAGREHAALIGSSLRGVARRLRVLEPPDLPEKGDVSDFLAAGGSAEALYDLASAAPLFDEWAAKQPTPDLEGDDAADGPLPLFPPHSDAEPYPVEALGSTLSRAATAIASKCQLPLAMAAQSVLAAASLAASAHADVKLPFGHKQPISLFCLTIAESGDRKSTADKEALWPLRKREEALREQYVEAMRDYKVAHAAWEAQKRKIAGSGKLSYQQRQMALQGLGKEPERPLEPILTSTDPTIEGLAKHWPYLPAAFGVFSTEGGTFTAGHGMKDENRARTAGGLSELWDGVPMKRIRACDDRPSWLYGRRLSLHLMVQPGVAAAFLSSERLKDQGLLSRFLLAQPDSLAGTRLYRAPSPDDDAAINAYGARLLSILEAEPALANNRRNELAPLALPLSSDATEAWIKFHDHVERQCKGELFPIKAFANKAAEHAARIAAVITVIENIKAMEIGADAMKNAITLIDWYLGEACRLDHDVLITSELRRAAALLKWLQAQPDKKVHVSHILRLGPDTTRTKKQADEALKILTEHRWVSVVSKRPCIIEVAAS